LAQVQSEFPIRNESLPSLLDTMREGNLTSSVSFSLAVGAAYSGSSDFNTQYFQITLTFRSWKPHNRRLRPGTLSRSRRRDPRDCKPYTISRCSREKYCGTQHPERHAFCRFRSSQPTDGHRLWSLTTLATSTSLREPGRSTRFDVRQLHWTVPGQRHRSNEVARVVTGVHLHSGSE
jgi:hypothetical protein